MRHPSSARWFCVHHCVGAQLRLQNVGSSRTDGFSMPGWWPIPRRTFSPRPRGAPGIYGAGNCAWHFSRQCGIEDKDPFYKSHRSRRCPSQSSGQCRGLCHHGTVLTLSGQRCREWLVGIFTSVKYLLRFPPLNWMLVLSGWAGCHFQQSPSSCKHVTLKRVTLWGPCPEPMELEQL